MIGKFFYRLLVAFIFVFNLASIEAKQLPDLDPKTVKAKLNEIMKAHVTYKSLNPILVKRALQNYIEELDPSKTYFIESDIHEWLEPSEALLDHVLRDYENSNFSVFEEIFQVMLKAIDRRHELEKKINLSELPKHVSLLEFKDMKWAQNEEELLKRLEHIKALQIESAGKLSEEAKGISLQRVSKRQAKYEEELMSQDPIEHQRLLLSDVLKAFASSLDAHTAYFTPGEASQFMINVQQRLFGIGAQLRDDISGFSVVKIVEGGPASRSELKVKDRIIAVNGEPVVGMDIEDAVDLIRGEENTLVTLTVIRETNDNNVKFEHKLDIPITRGEVVLKETRYESSYEPFGDGAIAYLRLYSFYQDSELSSSATDLAKELKKIKEDHSVKGVVLDLRYNSGGLLTQAVAVTGLFITKGIVVSIKEENGTIQHLRDLDGKTIWDGPLIVLINRASASASEIVAQTLQDYGRALIVGDDHSYGKGSFQTFTLNNSKGNVNPQGEYKVTRGKYYTVSGRSPQLTGVLADIVIPGPLTEIEIGESHAKNPLENDSIKPNFEDDLSDIPYSQREKIAGIYKFDLQKKLDLYSPYLDLLKKNSAERIKNSKIYQNFLAEIKKKESENDLPEEDPEQLERSDLQLLETYSVMKDLIFLMTK